MLETCTKINTNNMTRKDWLEFRRKGIGGSDAAAIVNLSKYSTPYTVYLDKIGVSADQEETEAMRQGRDLEEYVASRFHEETGRKVARVNAIIQNPNYPFALANIDRRIVGENAGLECKTTKSINMRRFRDVEFPEQYYAQCVHYMAVTGADRWYLAVLVLGDSFLVYTLDRDQAEIDALMNAEKAFWTNHVAKQVPPPVSGMDPDSDAICTLYRDSVPDAVDLMGMESVFSSLSATRDLIDSAKKREAELMNQIKLSMGTAERASCGDWTVTWKTQERSTVDVSRLCADHPELDISPYRKLSTSRSFRLRQK